MDNIEAKVSGIGLTSILQMLGIDRRSCSLLLKGGGRFDLDAGRIKNAEYRCHQGIDAALAMLDAPVTEFSLETLNLQSSTIDIPVDHLLLEAACRQDNKMRKSNDEDDLSEFKKNETKTVDDSDLIVEEAMSGIKESLSRAMKISGAIGVAIVDYKSGMTLGTLGGSDLLDIDLAASSNTDVVSAKIRAIKNLSLKDKIQDILITLSSQYHLIRVFEKYPDLFVYLALGREQANLALARMKLAEIEKEFELD